MTRFRLYTLSVSVFILLLVISGCFLFPRQSIVKTYGGSDPKGDYIEVVIDSTAQTVTHHNYTTNENNGPFSYFRVTDPSRNKGFTILYETEPVNAAGEYALFTLMDGVALIYQMFDSMGTPGDYTDDVTMGNPVYALSRVEVNMNTYQGTAYNWLEMKIGAAQGNFAAGFAAFDSNSDAPAGRLYGAGYNNRAEVEGWAGFVNGINNINNPPVLATSAFTMDSTIKANTCNTANGLLTMIGAGSGDFILDFGVNPVSAEGNGAGFALRQAAVKDWQPVYNGVYFALVYENNAGGTAQKVQPMKFTTNNGNIQVFKFDDGTGVFNQNFSDLETFSGGPGGSPVTAQFQTVSGCAGAESTVVQNAYQCHGGFIWSDSGSVVVCMMDPAGRYMFFTMFEKIGLADYNYRFGFAIKDPEL